MITRKPCSLRYSCRSLRTLILSSTAKIVVMLVVYRLCSPSRISSSIWRKTHGSNQARFFLVITVGRFLPGFTILSETLYAARCVMSHADLEHDGCNMNSHSLGRHPEIRPRQLYFMNRLPRRFIDQPYTANDIHENALPIYSAEPLMERNRNVCYQRTI